MLYYFCYLRVMHGASIKSSQYTVKLLSNKSIERETGIFSTLIFVLYFHNMIGRKYYNKRNWNETWSFFQGPLAFYKGFLPNFGRLGSWNVIMFLTLEQVITVANLLHFIFCAAIFIWQFSVHKLKCIYQCHTFKQLIVPEMIFFEVSSAGHEGNLHFQDRLQLSNILNINFF